MGLPIVTIHMKFTLTHTYCNFACKQLPGRSCVERMLLASVVRKYYSVYNACNSRALYISARRRGNAESETTKVSSRRKNVAMRKRVTFRRRFHNNSTNAIKTYIYPFFIYNTLSFQKL